MIWVTDHFATVLLVQLALGGAANTHVGSLGLFSCGRGKVITSVRTKGPSASLMQDAPLAACCSVPFLAIEEQSNEPG